MPNKPDDRPKTQPVAGPDVDPKIFVVINGTKFPRPALETYFAQPVEERPAGCSCHPVVGVYCQCNKVCTCVPVCGCVGHVSCSCDSHSSGGGGCRCAPVH